jgi:hypothetical protein
LKTKRLIWASPLLVLSFALTGCLGRGAASPAKPTSTPVHIALAVKKPQPNPALEPVAGRLVASRLLIGKGVSLVQAATDAQDQGLSDSAIADARDALRDFTAASLVLTSIDPPAPFLDAFSALDQTVRAYTAALGDLVAQRKGAAAALARATVALRRADSELRSEPEMGVGSVKDRAAITAARALAATRVHTTPVHHQTTHHRTRPAVHATPKPTAPPTPAPTARPAPAATNTAAPSAYMLAELEHHGPLPFTSPLVARFQRDLSILDRKCVEQESVLASDIASAHDTLRGNGLHVSYLAVLDGFLPYVDTAPSRITCEPMVSMYVTNRQEAFHPTPVVVAVSRPPARHAAPARPKPPVAAPPAPALDNPQAVANARAAAQATTLALARGPVAQAIPARHLPAAHLLDRLRTIQSQLRSTVALLRSYQTSADPRLQAEIDNSRSLLTTDINAATARLTVLRIHGQAAGTAPSLHLAIVSYRRTLQAIAGAEDDAAIAARAHFAEDLDAVTVAQHAGDQALDQASARLAG